ncbi:TetR/AcrR family transcriptional regulator [Cellulomonas endophytica]|uniref:TetR/AcrR family transcriptional regulator n=1 Tax=Cellulomonas endophytica TaxID=2494735 RepID=UPI0010123D56|nr:TetR/AcrR family transcriptional regulator [Cellulomonas endophytica]
MTATVLDALAARQGSPVARRILAAAAPLLYAQGLRAVSADRVIAAAGTTKVTFYRHFPTKDALVVAYLEGWHALEREGWDALVAAVPDPREALVRLGEALREQACAPGFRGCAFVNAGAEFADGDHPVRRVVDRHRAWWREAVGDLLRRAGAGDPAAAADALLVVRDGVLVAGDADGADAAGAAGALAWRAVLAVALPSPP